MGSRYHHLAFGPQAVARQQATGSVVAYGAHLTTPVADPDELSGPELAMIANVFQFHLVTVTPAGWPYVQYRSGPRGFLHHLGGNRLGFADFHGNQQFVTAGNIDSEGRVALFLADFPRKRRIKLFGTAEVVSADADPALLDRLGHIGEQKIAARCERSILIEVEAFDWNYSRSLIHRPDPGPAGRSGRAARPLAAHRVTWQL